MESPPTVTVIVVTIDRPECVRQCVNCLLTQGQSPRQIIVVDSSVDSATRNVCATFDGVDYLHNDLGLGHTTHSRNMGIMLATGTIVAFLDDDAYARPDWLTNLVAAYDDPTVGAVGGRALNGQPGEETLGVDLVGRVTTDGQVLGYFAADTGRVVDVDHVIGCNMSIRRQVLAACGGFREGFSGRYCFREESDIFLVMKRLGYRVRFTPFAVVDHVAGPKPRGKRFDIAYAYYAERNHYILLVRNFGLSHRIVWRYLFWATMRSIKEFIRRVGGAICRMAAFTGGTLVGLVVGFVWRWRQGRDVARRDDLGHTITSALARGPAAVVTESDGDPVDRVCPEVA